MTKIESSDRTDLKHGWFLEIISGPMAGSRSYLKPGQVMRCGRGAGVGIACPHDQHMSGLHFAVQCDKTTCKIKDLKSRNGTFVNGTRIHEAALSRDDLVMAGQTVFTLGFDDVGAHRLAEALQPMSANPSAMTGPAERLLSLLSNNFQPLYAIVDSARDRYAFALLLQSKSQYQSLYEGPKGESLSDVAPYLVSLPKDSDFLSKLVREGWGKSWGVYLKCAAEFQDVRRHLRHFMEVRHPDGEQVYFRFYDPRVLRLYLPGLSKDEAAQFLGPIQCYLMEDEKPNQLLQFVNTGQGVAKVAIPLSLAQPSGTTSPPGALQTQAVR